MLLRMCPEKTCIRLVLGPVFECLKCPPSCKTCNSCGRRHFPFFSACVREEELTVVAAYHLLRESTGERVSFLVAWFLFTSCLNPTIFASVLSIHVPLPLNPNIKGFSGRSERFIYFPQCFLPLGQGGYYVDGLLGESIGHANGFKAK
ncbi:hypothetical protein CEXT_493641 [Caerostris extrusa]|uniref:Uncharacterized protein n=1 Tax=Caerostris extrusa TaxID=172846 RepID=A0AAV4PJ00_CAEEX|nr:hypothetical protein CEXT_493641 [Caerostris extrusa]